MKLNIYTKSFYILWDEDYGYKINNIYLDYLSAEIGLNENYTEYWIKNEKAKIEKINAKTYFSYKK